MALRERFWETVPLEQMSRQEWEALCDGCGKCCLHKLQDEDTDEVYYTRVACELLDADSCTCTDYPRRQERVAECLVLDQANIGELDYLPSTCAYRLLSRNQGLPAWHYLLTGDRESIHRAGASVRGRTLSALYVHSDAMQEHIIHWIE
jgi:hypothetical protein